MRGLVAVALILGIAGTALGVAALIDDSNGAFKKKTLKLTDGKITRTNFHETEVATRNPLGAVAWTSSAPVTGDAAGQHTVTCAPISDNDIDCEGSFVLGAGTIQYDSTAQVHRGQSQAASSIIGGTGDYDGTTGTMKLDFKKHVYELHLLIPRK